MLEVRSHSNNLAKRGHGEKGKREKMTLTVNGEKISGSEIEKEIERLRPHYEQYVREHDDKGSDDQLREWSRENLIERILIRQEARKDTLDIPIKEIDEAFEKTKDNFKGIKKKDIRSEIELQLKVDRLMKKVTDNAPGPAKKELEKYYNDNIDRFGVPEQVHVRHIEKRVEGGDDKTDAYVEMLNILERLRKGESFEGIANECSDCPNNDLGYFGRGQMVQEFDNVVFSMKAGEISDVFQTGFGYHIAKVYDRRPPTVIPLKDVEERISEMLTEEKRNKVLEGFVDSLKAKAEIKIS
ncbi:peptidylprolyl isomerase [Verrucomicrobiota bacterium]